VGNYFLEAQPQPEDFFSSCLIMQPVSAHWGHFFGLHLPSLVAPHFSHLNTAIFFNSFLPVVVSRNNVFYPLDAFAGKK
jgi:hypothetical protein